jgi:hypothetical protein
MLWSGNDIMSKKVLICIPTKGRSGMVEDVLRFESGCYKEFGINVRYYDSSEENETCKAVERRINTGQCNYTWAGIPAELCLDCKLVYILKNDATILEYDYIWFINDSISITREALKEIMPLLVNDYDLIRLPLPGFGSREDRIIYSPVQWFEEVSYGMSFMATTIMSTSLLKVPDMDWNELEEQYIGTNDINDPDHGFFFMVGFYLEQILKLEQFKGLVIGNRLKWYRVSALKKGQSYWNDIVFDVWARSYPDTIYNLPDKYVNKEDVIRQSDNVQQGRFGVRALISYRIRGLFNPSVYRKYKKRFNLISNVPQHRIALIAYAPAFMLRLFGRNNKTDESEWKKRLHSLYKVLDSKKHIIIYGAGIYGEKCVEELMASSLVDKVLCVAVTDENANVATLSGQRVYGVASLTEFAENSIVLIAALPDIAEKIRPVLKTNKFKHVVELF